MTDLPTPRSPDRAAASQRALHVKLPQEALVRLKIVAAISRMPIKAFLSRLILTAKPFLEVDEQSRPVDAQPYDKRTAEELITSIPDEPLESDDDSSIG